MKVTHWDEGNTLMTHLLLGMEKLTKIGQNMAKMDGVVCFMFFFVVSSDNHFLYLDVPTI